MTTLSPGREATPVPIPQRAAQQYHPFHTQATICDAADAESLLVRLYEKLNAEEQEKVRKKILDGAPKKYCFSKQSFKDTIDDLCFGDHSDMTEFSEEQKRWKKCERKTNEMKKEWLLKIYNEFYKHCVPTCASSVFFVFHWLYPSLCSMHYFFHPVFFVCLFVSGFV